MGRFVPTVDPDARRRLSARFGAGVGRWFDELPTLLQTLGDRWQVEFGAAIPRGSVCVVFRCRTAGNQEAVLKVSPDRARVAVEAAALQTWHTVHAPAVFGHDERLGALLIEAIEPGTPLSVSAGNPHTDAIAQLLSSLHTGEVRLRSFPAVHERVDYLFEASFTVYDRDPGIAAVVPRELYERGRALASRLAAEKLASVLLHGDLTPSNVLDGGPGRGLVAIDPAPCIGDAAFDAVDLVLWQAETVDAVNLRAEQIATRIGAAKERIMAWCSAFAAMNALELVSQTPSGRAAVNTLLDLANRT